eukprot:GHVU01015971.1.p2 GENE.GHVU01015971.1~~GHVU01015971.1.p2  ORF type:complete len:105 (+),score=0.50 GHVU01015971.1:84-398(+)
MVYLLLFECVLMVGLSVAESFRWRGVPVLVEAVSTAGVTIRVLGRHSGSMLAWLVLRGRSVVTACLPPTTGWYHANLKVLLWYMEFASVILGCVYMRYIFSLHI